MDPAIAQPTPAETAAPLAADSPVESGSPAAPGSKAEIERLLAHVGGAGAAAAAALVLADKPRPRGEDSAEPHAFPQLASFSEAELRVLQARHEEYVRALAAQLTNYLRLECGLQLSGLQTGSFQQFLDGLAGATHLTLLNLEPLRGTCFLDLPPQLAHALVDRELGGPGVCLDESRTLNKMEAQLLARVVEIFAGDWCRAWRDTLELRPVLLGHESNPRFLETFPPETPMLVLDMETHLGELVQHVKFAFPCSALQPLLAALNAKTPVGVKPSASAIAPPVWNPALSDIRVPIVAELHDVQVAARDLAGLKPGDLLPLPPEMAGQVRIRLAGTTKFIGQLGTCDQHWAVKISQVLSS